MLPIEPSYKPRRSRPDSWRRRPSGSMAGGDVLQKSGCIRWCFSRCSGRVGEDKQEPGLLGKPADFDEAFDRLELGIPVKTVASSRWAVATQNASA